jgi:hypothetical protein
MSVSLNNILFTIDQSMYYIKVVHTCLTSGPSIASRTYTGEPIDVITTGATVLTWVAGTLIDVCNIIE